MNKLTPSPFTIIAWLRAVLTALFGASAHCVRRVAALRGRRRVAFARLAQRWAARGHAIAYVGEDDATVAKRIARMEWISADPVKAFRHMARGARGFMRALLCGTSAPPSFAPPVLACVALVAGIEGMARAPDT